MRGFKIHNLYKQPTHLPYSSEEEMKEEIRHGKNPKQWAGSITKKFCRKHFNEYNNLGWLSKEDNIQIVPQDECKSIDHIKIKS